MSGNHKGGLKAAKANVAKDPDFYKKIGKLGGQKGKTGGFYDKDLARRAGALGGAKSRRTGVKGGEGTSRSALRRKAIVMGVDFAYPTKLDKVPRKRKWYHLFKLKKKKNG